MIEEEILELAPRLSRLTSRQMNGRFTTTTRKLLRKLGEGNGEPHAIITGHLANLTPKEQEGILRELEEHTPKKIALEEIRKGGVLEDLRNFATRLRNLTRD